MSLKLSPATKGAITAVIMIALALFFDIEKDKINPKFQYLIFITYGLGIIWTLIIYSRSAAFAGNFSSLFNQGFKCFIIISFVMVIFTAIFIKAHPEFAEQDAVATKEYYIKQGDKTPAEIDDIAAKAKKQFAVTFISISIFRYLIFGAVVTAATSALLTRRK